MGGAGSFAKEDVTERYSLGEGERDARIRDGRDVPCPGAAASIERERERRSERRESRECRRLDVVCRGRTSSGATRALYCKKTVLSNDKKSYSARLATFAATAFFPAAPTRWLLPLVVFLTPAALAPLCLRASLVLSRCWSRQPAPPCQWAPPGLVKVLPQCAHGASEYGISREHFPQIIRVAHTPIAAAGQSDASWQTAHGYARAQHGKRSQRCESL